MTLSQSDFNIKVNRVCKSLEKIMKEMDEPGRETSFTSELSHLCNEVNDLMESHDLFPTNMNEEDRKLLRDHMVNFAKQLSSIDKHILAMMPKWFDTSMFDEFRKVIHEWKYKVDATNKGEGVS